MFQRWLKSSGEDDATRKNRRAEKHHTKELHAIASRMSLGGPIKFRVSHAQLRRKPSHPPRDRRTGFNDIPRRTNILFLIVDYNEFLQILNRPNGWRPAGTEGTPLQSSRAFPSTFANCSSLTRPFARFVLCLSHSLAPLVRSRRRIRQRLPSVRQRRPRPHRRGRTSLRPHPTGREDDGRRGRRAAQGVPCCVSPPGGLMIERGLILGAAMGRSIMFSLYEASLASRRRRLFLYSLFVL